MTIPEEEGRDGALASWVVVLLICAAVVCWGLLNYLLVRDRPRAFNFGALPDAPGESRFSTRPAPPAPTPPRQMPPLPEAKPWQPPVVPKAPEGRP